MQKIIVDPSVIRALPVRNWTECRFNKVIISLLKAKLYNDALDLLNDRQEVLIEEGGE